MHQFYLLTGWSRHYGRSYLVVLLYLWRDECHGLVFGEPHIADVRADPTLSHYSEIERVRTARSEVT